MAPLVLRKQKDEEIQIQEQKQKVKNRILYLDNVMDDDLYKIYYIESQTLRNKWYRVIATAFGTTSCSCMDQTKNSYLSCIHMKKVDKILKNSPDNIQQLKQVPQFILDIF